MDLFAPPFPLCYNFCDFLRSGENEGLYRRSSEKKGAFMTKYVCQVCGYVYDPAEGDPENKVEPGTAFKDLPKGWVCPICGAEVDQFEPEA